MDQVGLGVYPLLHTQARGSALVLGAGTLSTALALDRAGLARVSVVEDDPDLVAFARRLRPAEIAAHVVVADARGFLLVTHRTWDVIVIDDDDVWSPAGASLHTRELVALAKAKLAPGGVLAVSFPLHRVDGEAIVDFVATVHGELPSTWLYAGEARGAVVACAEPCPPRQANLAALDRAPEAQRLLAVFGSARGARRHLVLDPPRVARLDRSGTSPLTDDDLRLAYASQRGAALGYDATLPENRAFLASLSQRLTPDRP